MIRSRLHNETFSSESDLRAFYLGFLDKSNLHRQVNKFRALKLISDQYIDFRKKTQDITDPRDLFEWLTANQIQSLNVPLSFLLGQFPTKQWDRIDILSFDRDHIGYDFFLHSYVEEELFGPAWRGIIRIHGSICNIKNVRRGFASLGIYICDSLWFSGPKAGYYQCEIIILARDFKFSKKSCEVVQKTHHEDEDDEELSDLDFKLFLIEEGLADEEDPRI